MFRITINNEEVLCDKDFTIKEEMLNTPSVILNNVYPKTWETNKDYTTNFYHPEDYSKCIIGDETYMTESQGTTVSGSNLSINYDKRRFYELYGKGNTSQNTTTGKNMLDPSRIQQTTKNGITSSYDSETQTITFNGTSTANNNTFYFMDSNQDIPNVVSGTTKLTAYYVSGTITTYLQVRVNEEGWAHAMNLVITDIANRGKITGTANSSFTTATNCVSFRFDNGSVATNLKIKIMVSDNANTDYEPYTNGASPNPEYPQEVDTTTGGQEIIVENKNIARIKNSLWYNSTAMIFQNNNVCYGFYAQVLPSTTYTISKENEGNRFVVITSETEPVNNSSLSRILVAESSTTRKNYTFTTNSNEKYVFFGCYRGNDQEEQETACKNVQIEQGNQATTFEEYKGTTAELNLGKNLFNKNNVSVLNAYFSTTQTTIAANDVNRTIYIPCKPNTTYTIQKIYSAQFTVGYTNETPNINTQVYGISASQTVFNTNYRYITITTGSKAQYIVCRMYQAAQDRTITFDEVCSTIQIEQGHLTSYAPYITPIELCKIGNYQDFIRKGTGKNLFDKNIPTIVNVLINSSLQIISSSNATTIYIPCKPNTTYTVKRFYYSTADITVFTSANEITVGNTVSQRITGTNDTSYTITSGNSDKYLGVYIYFGTDATVRQNVINNLQIELGSQSTPYEPYGYKDKWYIYKVIGKVVLDGSETWTAQWASNNRYGYRTSINNIFIAPNNNTSGYIKSNYFRNYTQNELFALTTGSGTGISLRTSQSEIIIRNDSQTSVANFKTWLGSNNTLVYYVLETPTILRVRDAELISQLDKVKLLAGVNNININSGNVPLILDLHYNFNPNYYYVDKLYFSGVVKNSGDISLNPRYPHYSTLQILDFKTFLSEGETLDFVIADKTILEAIQMVVDAISEYGFVLGNVNILTPNDIIGAYSTENKTAYDVFNYIADITQSRWTTRVIDDNTVAIDFYDPTLLPEGKQIEYNQNWFCENLIDDMSYSYNAQDYRNKQVMTSNEIIADITQTETLVANGYDKNFITEQKIGKVVSITLNGVEKSIITNGEKDMGFSADFHYGVGNNYFENSINIPLGSIITITYYPIIQGRQIIKNNDEINRIATSINRKGVVSRYENRNDSITSLELQKIGQSYIKYKGTSEILLTIQTRNDLWNIGDRVFFNAPINELKKEYMVKEKEINYIKTVDTIFYTFTLSSSFNSENAINYFDNQRAKMNGNIEEGDFISRNIDIENSMNIIFQNATAEIIQIDGDNRLQSTLTSPLTN